MVTNTRPLPQNPTEYGNVASFWVEYPSGLIDLSRSRHILEKGPGSKVFDVPPPLDAESQLDIPVDQERTVRINKSSSAIVIIDMQKCDFVTFTFSYSTSKFIQFLPSSRLERPSGWVEMR
jgi:hypothetical protein